MKLKEEACSSLGTVLCLEIQKGEGGNEDIGISTGDHRDFRVHGENNEGYKRVWRTSARKHIIFW